MPFSNILWKNSSKLSALGWITLQVFLTSMLVVAFIILISVVAGPLFSPPSVEIIDNGMLDIGVVCVGQPAPLLLTVKVREPAIATYHISVHDAAYQHAIVDATRIFDGIPYESKGIFEQPLPWLVPRIPPGAYILVVSVHGVDGDEEFSAVNSKMFVKEKCP